jgi:hypothetical protein
MSNNHDRLSGIERLRGTQHMPEQSLAAELVQHFWCLRAHARAFAGRHDDDLYGL